MRGRILRHLRVCFAVSGSLRGRRLSAPYLAEGFGRSREGNATDGTGGLVRNLFANLCLLLVACVVGLALCEASLRLFYPKYRNVAETRLSRNAIRIFANVPDSRHWRSHHDTHMPYAVYHNNLALRQHRNFSEEDLNSAVNIGVFGDSFVESMDVAAPYSFTEPLDYLLNQSGRHFNVLNFGVSGYGPGQSFLHYENFYRAQKLDYVFFVYCSNDLANLYGHRLFHQDAAGRLVRNAAIRSSWWAPSISRFHLPYLLLDAGGRLSPYMKETSYEDVRKRGARNRSAAEEGRRIWKLFRSKGWESSKEGKASLAVFRQLLRHWKQMVERDGNVFHVVTLPDRPYPHISSLLAEEEIQVIDLHDCFSGHDEEHRQRQWAASPYRLKNNPHLNEAGNQRIAVCLYRFLEKAAGLPTLSKERLWAAIQRYYAAFGGWMPREREGQRIAVSPQVAADIRNTYTALEQDDLLEERLGQLVATRDRRLIDAPFDVYLGERHLVYVKEGRCPTGRPAPFFLHITPTEREDLLPDRVQYGFNNHDFSSEGIELDATSCLVMRRLPEYAIRRISTGQYVPGTGRLWGGEFSVDQAVGGGAPKGDDSARK